MPLQISKVVEFYEKCGEILKTKADLYLCFSIFSENQRSSQSTQSENSLTIIHNYFQKFMCFWMEEMLIYQNYHPIHLNTSNILFAKANNFKNKTELLSKQEQLTAQLTQIVDSFKNSTDPVSFYTLKKRIKIKEQIMQKLTEIKKFSVKTSETYRPMFPHKFQKEMKESFYQVYNKQVETDIQTLQKTEKIYHKIMYQCQKIKNYLKEYPYPQILPSYKSKFFEENYEIISNKRNIKQQQLTQYCYNINKVTKNFYNFWHFQRKSLQNFIKQILKHKEILNKVKDNSNTIVQKFYEALEQMPNEIWKLLRISKILNIIKMLDKNLFLIEILAKLIKKLNKQRDLLFKFQKQSRQYLTNISKNISQRNKNFHIYLLDDKKYLQDQCRAQKYFNQVISQTLNDFFQECLLLLKQTNEITTTQPIQGFQFHQVSSIITKILTQDDHEGKNSKYKQNPKNSRSITSNEKSQKLKGFQNFLQSLIIFNNSELENYECITCALGPRLLLHGKIYALQNGIYFQSVFNKKNLFFGKTKLFIPKEDVLQINLTNALMIFPDIVQITTTHGPINIHALGSRQKIFNSLTSNYFPQNIRSDVEGYSEKDFNQCNISFHENENLEDRKPLEMVLSTKIFQGCKLNKFFRRYLSDDEFEIKGKVYDSFKSYFLMTVVEAKDPTGTPITPEPPLYFQYTQQKKEQSQIPNNSQRIHTYGKMIPTIPFLAKGGEGLCQDKQYYTWISPKVLILVTDSVIKGFSLTEGMVVKTKFVYEELPQGLKVQVSAFVYFTTTSSTNSLIKGPTISSVKSSMQKMNEIIEKYEKGRGGSKKVKGQKTQNLESQSLRQQLQILQKQNNELKNKLKYGIIIFIGIYIASLMIFLNYI